MMIRKRIKLIFLTLLFCSLSIFANDRRVKFGYKDQFTLYDANKSVSLTFYETLDDAKDFFSAFDCNLSYESAENCVIAGNNHFYFSNQNGYIEKIILEDDLFFISDDLLHLKNLSFEDVQDSYGPRAERIFMSSSESEDKINVLRRRPRMFMPFKKDEFPINSIITFTFDYNSMICEKIVIEFVYEKAASIEG